MSRAVLFVLVLSCAIATGCARRPGAELVRRGDEIVVCGRMFHTGVPVVLWTDPGGYDAYRTEKRFVAWDKAPWRPPVPTTGGSDSPSSPNRFGFRFAPGSEDGPITAAQFEKVRTAGWDLPTLRTCVDQIVLHYDAAGTSRQCFRTLHDVRGLSIHFMIDLDGTIYQTLDVKEKAWHATTSNDRSVGIEIANVGAYGPDEPNPFDRWYAPPANANAVQWVRITIPETLGDGGVRTRGFVARPARPGPIVGEVQDRSLRQFDFTPEQYHALAHLVSTLCAVLDIPCDFPRDKHGALIPRALDADALRSYRGLIGHYHIQSNKVDPGPAMNWDLLTTKARARLSPTESNW